MDIFFSPGLPVWKKNQRIPKVSLWILQVKDMSLWTELYSPPASEYTGEGTFLITATFKLQKVFWKDSFQVEQVSSVQEKVLYWQIIRE